MVWGLGLGAVTVGFATEPALDGTLISQMGRDCSPLLVKIVGGQGSGEDLEGPEFLGEYGGNVVLLLQDPLVYQ